MSDTGVPPSAIILGELLALVIILFLARGAVIAVWGAVKLICGAAFLIPCGLALIGIAAWLVGITGGHGLAILAALWLGYHGLNAITTGLSGFAGGNPARIDTPDGATTATRRQLRRAGLIGRR